MNMKITLNWYIIGIIAIILIIFIRAFDFDTLLGKDTD